MSRSQLKKIRERARMSQAELAEKSGVSVQYVAKLEQTGVLPGLEIAKKLAAALAVEADQLFFRPGFGLDRVAPLGEFYPDELSELSSEDRAMVVRYVVCADPSAWKIIARGKLSWADLWSNSLAFDDHLKKFPKK